MEGQGITPIAILLLDQAKFRMQPSGSFAMYKTSLAHLDARTPEDKRNRGAYNIQNKLDPHEMAAYNDWIVPGDTCMPLLYTVH